MSLPARDLMAAVAVTRFGLGARPGEIEAASADPQAWLAAQIRSTGADQPAQGEVPQVGDRLEDVRDAAQAKQVAKAGMAAAAPAAGKIKVPAKGDLRSDIGDDFLSRARLGATTPDSFRERWALFWANHFTVSGTKQVTAALVGPFEREAIRPHVFGRFEDMLMASSTHAAMLTYLDQAQSVGPDSVQARRAGARAGAKRQVGLNENLGREIMELHTLGVEAGYSQADVTEFARALTGWSFVAAQGAGGEPGAFIFRSLTHEPGARTILGKHYAQAGVEQGRAALRDFAASPHTASHLATKIARHFVADDPPPALVARLAKSYTNSNGRLDVVAKALIASDEAWQAPPAKFKTPYEFLISSHRAAGSLPQAVTALAPTLTAMGQKPFSAPSPRGWDDVAATWAAPDAVVKRLVWSQAFAARAKVADPNGFAKAALGARLSPAAATAVARAETRPEAVALLLMSPEFQRR